MHSPCSDHLNQYSRNENMPTLYFPIFNENLKIPLSISSKTKTYISELIELQSPQNKSNKVNMVEIN